MKIPPETYGLLGLLLAIGMGLFWISIRSRFEEQQKEFLLYCSRDDGLKAHLIHLHRAGPGSMTTILSGDPNTKWMSRKKYRDAIKEAVEFIGYSYEYEDEFEAIVIRRREVPPIKIDHLPGTTGDSMEDAIVHSRQTDDGWTQ